jgi:puromycin-sensitive aminopeptidase
MVEQYLTEPVFQKGISIYLNRHQFANTETGDLWAALEEASKQPVVDMMNSWIYQPGYPMISVETTGGGKALKLSQQRFFYLSEGADTKQRFHVPIMLRAKCGGQVVTRKLLLKDESTTVELPETPEWVVVNEGGHGFYRVRYSSELLQALTANVFSILSPIERFNLINDTWAMVLAGHTSLEQYLTTALLFVDETDKNVWSVLCGSLTFIDRLVSDEARANFEGYVRKLLTAIHQKVGWQQQKTDGELTGQLRGMLISTLGTIGNDKTVQEKAVEWYGKYKQDKTSVDPNIVGALVNTLAHVGDSKRYDEFLNEFKSAKTPQEEERYLYALGGFRQKELLEQTLERCLNGEVRTQNAPYLIRVVMANTVGREPAWSFTKKNWDEINSKFPNNSIPRMLEGITALVDPRLEKDVVSFFQAHPVKSGAKTVDQHMERLHMAVKFKEREAQALRSGFKA